MGQSKHLGLSLRGAYDGQPELVGRPKERASAIYLFEPNWFSRRGPYQRGHLTNRPGAADSLSLHFKAINPYYSGFPIAPGPLDIQLGGTSLSLIPTYSNGGYVEYGADVSAWQGQTVELSIKVLTTPVYSPNFPEGVAYLDSFAFSPTEAPEPGFLSLLLFGSALLARRLYRP